MVRPVSWLRPRALLARTTRRRSSSATRWSNAGRPPVAPTSQPGDSELVLQGLDLVEEIADLPRARHLEVLVEVLQRRRTLIVVASRLAAAVDGGQVDVGGVHVGGSRRRLEVGPAVAQVRLEVGALRPLVPGVDQDELVASSRWPCRSPVRATTRTSPGSSRGTGWLGLRACGGCCPSWARRTGSGSSRATAGPAGPRPGRRSRRSGCWRCVCREVAPRPVPRGCRRRGGAGTRRRRRTPCRPVPPCCRTWRTARGYGSPTPARWHSSRQTSAVRRGSLRAPHVVDEEDRTVADADVPLVSERRHEPPDVTAIVLDASTAGR